jgi:hypothetical protein
MNTDDIPPDLCNLTLRKIPLLSDAESDHRWDGNPRLLSA